MKTTILHYIAIAQELRRKQSKDGVLSFNYDDYWNLQTTICGQQQQQQILSTG